MRPIFLCLFLASSAFALTCPTGSTVLTSIGGGGNASNSATWGGTAIGNGNGKCLQINGPVVIDQDLGTSGGTGIYTIFLNSGGSISLDNTAARHIYWASTGTNPIGSGSCAAPGTDSTMYGIFGNGGGNISLVGTQANPVMITSADGVHPWYIDDAGAHTSGAAYLFQWVDFYHLGVGTLCGGVYPEFAGIFAGDNGTAVSIEADNCRVTDFYGFLSSQTGGASITAANDVLTGRRGPITFNGGLNAITGVSIVNVTETAPTANGTLEIWPQITGSYTSTGNVTLGTASFAMGGIQAQAGVPNASTTVNHNAYINNYAQAGEPTGDADGIVINDELSTPLSVYSVFCEYCNHSIKGGSLISTSAFVEAYNWVAITNYLAQSGQGAFYSAGGHMKWHNNLGILVDGNLGTSNPSMYAGYNAVNGGSTIESYYNTAYSITPSTTFTNDTTGINMGDNAQVQVNNFIHHNLVVNFYNGVVDSATPVPSSYFPGCPGGFGVCFNNVWNSTIPYFYNVRPINWDNGVNTHPNAVYGDLTVEPAFVDPTRGLIETYDKRVLGGPGTAADWVTKMGYRSGWGGTYTLGSTPIQDVIDWTMAGFVPGNSAVCPPLVGKIGVMNCQSPATAFLPQP